MEIVDSFQVEQNTSRKGTSQIANVGNINTITKPWSHFYSCVDQSVHFSVWRNTNVFFLEQHRRNTNVFFRCDLVHKKTFLIFSSNHVVHVAFKRIISRKSINSPWQHLLSLLGLSVLCNKNFSAKDRTLHNSMSLYAPGSVMTPYCSEETVYSKSDLDLENQDGVSIIFYLQKIYPGSISLWFPFSLNASIIYYYVTNFSPFLSWFLM